MPESGSVFHRVAARGIIAREDKLLFIHTRKGGYKFPGGGVEPEENIEHALAREILEEAGRVITGNPQLFARVHERRKGRDADILDMVSHYFLCQISAAAVPQRLSGEELEEEYQPVWAGLEEALAADMELVAKLGFAPWVQRDIPVMKALLNRA